MAPCLLVTLTERGRALVEQHVSPAERTGDDLLDLAKAFDVRRQIRIENSEIGGQIIAEALNVAHMDYDRGWPLVAEVLGESESTLRRWAEPYREDAWPS